MSEGRNLAPLDGAEGNLTRRLQALDSRRQALAPATAPREPAPPPRRILAPVARSGRGDADFHPALLAIDDAPSSPIRWWVVGAISALLVVALTWSYFGRLASYTESAGKIQAAGRTKVLEALAEGQVVKILTHDGDRVKAGATLIELDPTDALATRTIIDQKLTDLRAETLRLKVEIGAARVTTIDPKAKIPWGADVPVAVRAREENVAQAELAKLAAQIATLTSQRKAKEAERDKYVKAIAAQKALIAVTQENMGMIDNLTKRGYNSQAKYLDYKATLDGQQVTLTGYQGSLENAKQAILTIDSEIAKAREVFVTANVQTVATNEQSIVDLTQQLVKADQVLGNMTLRAPVAGIVHATAVTTIGQIVKPGQQLLQIVPTGGPLEIECYVTNTDIGFIQVGDPATIKVSTFVFGTYGSVDGKVVSIAAGAQPLKGKNVVQSASLDGEYRSTTTAQKTGNIQFQVIVRADKNTMMIDGKEVPLTPGMGVSVEIETEDRRAIDYIASPIEELFSTAGHEK